MGCKNKAKGNYCCWCHIINNLITETVWLLHENLKPRPIDFANLFGQYGKASV